MIYWYQTQPIIFSMKSFTSRDITVHILPSVQSCWIYLISGKKWHSIIGFLVQSSWCLMYNRHQYTPYYIMVTVSDWVIYTGTKYHLSCADPAAMWLMKKILSFDFSISILICLSALWSPVWASLSSCVELIPFPSVTDHPGYTGLCVLNHLNYQHWSHYQALYLNTNQTLVHVPTCYIKTMLNRPLFWLTQ